MAWIESHTVLIRHRKLRELSRELRLCPAYTMGHLHALWHTALEQQEDGDLSSWSDELIAESSGYPGDAPQYVRLLQKHRWLDGKLLHDWLDYAGNWLRRKYSTSDRLFLISIWAKHGREYGSDNKASRKRAESEQKDCLPKTTKPNQPTTEGVGDESGEFPERFVEFWACWPPHDRKADKKNCHRLWKKENLDTIAETIIQSVKRHKKSTNWLKDDGQFIPAPIVWLRKQGWEANVKIAPGPDGFVARNPTKEELEICGYPVPDEVKK